MMLSSSAQAAVVSWTGAVDGLWDTAGNWDSAVIWTGNPSTTPQIVIPAGAPNLTQTVGYTSGGPDGQSQPYGKKIASVTMNGGCTLADGSIDFDTYGNVGVTAGIVSVGNNTFSARVALMTKSWNQCANSPTFSSSGGLLTVNSPWILVKGITLTGDGNMEIYSDFSNGGTGSGGSTRSFNKTGSGTAWLKNGLGAAYWGSTSLPQVSSGELIFNGTNSNNGTPWNVRLGSLASDTVVPTLGGTGTLNTAAGVVIGGASAGNIAPGDPNISGGVGIFSVTGNTTIGNNGILKVQSGDLLAVSGLLDLSSLSDGLTVLGTIPSPCKIASYGTLNGTFDILSLPSGVSVDYSHAGEIWLTPEPATMSLLAIGLGMVIRRRSR
jgi:hypothetical protein